MDKITRNKLIPYLTEIREKGEHTKVLADVFARPAAILLLQSDAVAEGDSAGLRTLISDLKHLNAMTIEVARAHPDVFHANVARSREEENRVYDTVLALLDSSVPKDRG